jgi:beta-lactamase regulating signal transducer with metallopeptidase domain
MAAAAELLSLVLRANLALAAAVVLVALIAKPARLMFGAPAAYRLWLLPLVAALAAMAPTRRLGVPADLLIYRSDQGFAAAPFVLAAWLAGAALMVAILARLQMRFVRAWRMGAAGPAVVGFLVPRILVPADFEHRFTPQEQTLVLAHERTHLSRQDPRVNALAALVQCLCWFNPLAHLGAQLMRIDQELACDAQVIDQHQDERSAYARALLKAQLAGQTLPLGCYWPARAEHPLAARLDMLARRAPDADRRSMGAWALVWLSAAVWIGAWVAQPPTLELRQSRLVVIPGQRVPVMTPTGDMSSAVLPSSPNRSQAGAVPLMAPTGDSLPAYTPPETY